MSKFTLIRYVAMDMFIFWDANMLEGFVNALEKIK